MSLTEGHSGRDFRYEVLIRSTDKGLCNSIQTLGDEIAKAIFRTWSTQVGATIHSHCARLEILPRVVKAIFTRWKSRREAGLGHDLGSCRQCNAMVRYGNTNPIQERPTNIAVKSRSLYLQSWRQTWVPRLRSLGPQ